MDDDCITYIVCFLLALVAVGFAGSGLAWLYQNQLPYLITGVVVLCAILITWFMGTRPRRTTADSREIADKADRAARSLAKARHTVELETEALRRVRLGVRDEINFKVYRQAHRESRIAADRWYAHKRSALETRRGISVGLNKMREKKGRLERNLEHATSRRRRALVLEKQRTQSLIDALSSGLSSLNEEVDRGSRSLTEFNQQTGRLRDHIRDHCGPEGRRWYNRLESRKRNIIDRS